HRWRRQFLFVRASVRSRAPPPHRGRHADLAVPQSPDSGTSVPDIAHSAGPLGDGGNHSPPKKSPKEKPNTRLPTAIQTGSMGDIAPIPMKDVNVLAKKPSTNLTRSARPSRHLRRSLRIR